MQTLSLSDHPRATITTIREGELSLRTRKPPTRNFRRLIAALPKKPPSRVLVGRDPTGLTAAVVQLLWPESAVCTHHLDAFEAAAAERLFAEAFPEGEGPALLLQADAPEGPFDFITSAFPGRGDANLGRELLEAYHAALDHEGRLLVATDGKPRWLLGVVKRVFGKADLQGQPGPDGALVSSRRTKENARRKDHGQPFTVLRGDEILDFTSPPGTFAMGRLDSGTRALLAEFEAKPGQRVLDLGCGVGVLGLCAAADGAQAISLVDASTRAVRAAEANASAQGVGDRCEVLLRPNLEDLGAERFDLVLANPPYFSHGRIADRFAEVGASMLADDGRLLMVAKAVELHQEILEQHFKDVQVRLRHGYGIFEASQPRT